MSKEKRTPPKRKGINCRRAIKQFIGLKLWKCGMSWSKGAGYFERSPDMFFALERKVVKKARAV